LVFEKSSHTVLRGIVIETFEESSLFPLGEKSIAFLFEIAVHDPFC
jgi:hypothetical protein